MRDSKSPSFLGYKKEKEHRTLGENFSGLMKKIVFSKAVSVDMREGLRCFTLAMLVFSRHPEMEVVWGWRILPYTTAL